MERAFRSSIAFFWIPQSLVESHSVNRSNVGDHYNFPVPVDPVQYRNSGPVPPRGKEGTRDQKDLRDLRDKSWTVYQIQRNQRVEKTVP